MCKKCKTLQEQIEHYGEQIELLAIHLEKLYTQKEDLEKMYLEAKEANSEFVKEKTQKKLDEIKEKNNDLIDMERWETNRQCEDTNVDYVEGGNDE